MNRFDEQFNQQVKRAFASYNADHLADAGWKALQQKHGKTRRLFSDAPLWAKAATIALLLSLGGFITYKATQSVDEDTIAQAETSIFHEEVEVEKREQLVEKAETNDLSETQKPPIAEVTQIRSEKKASSETKLIITDDYNQPVDNLNDELLASTEVNENIHVLTELDTTAQASTIRSETQLAYHDNNETIASEEIIEESFPPFAKNEQEITQAMLAFNLSAIGDEESEKHKLNFGAGLSGMLAMVDDMVSSAPGVSIGLHADYALTDRISVRPGIAVAKHTFGLEQLPSSKNYASIELADNFYRDPVEHSQHINMLIMEIPINIVFSISKKQDRDLYITAGTSTLVYLNQHFTGNYIDNYRTEIYDQTTGEQSTSVNTVEVSIDNQYSAFSHTDPFGLINLSAGYSFPFGKKSKLQVEPFIQIPIGTLTSSNLKLGFGGVSLKYHFLR